MFFLLRLTQIFVVLNCADLPCLLAPENLLPAFPPRLATFPFLTMNRIARIAGHVQSSAQDMGLGFSAVGDWFILFYE